MSLKRRMDAARGAASAMSSGVTEAVADATSGASFFETDTGKLDVIRNQLESSNDKYKVLALKRLLALTSNGRNVSSLFPFVVKNAVHPSMEIKKLVYLYLQHYAELEPEAALLPINTLQKDLASQNQLQRAYALRVMTSIRVKLISQLQILALQKAMTDSSPYVRKTCAAALPKVYNLDPEAIDTLIEVLEHLLEDTSTMVLGTAVVAFNELCPDEYDLLHGIYGTLCHLVADFDEWCQVVVLGVLTRYARVHFRDPNQKDLERQAKREAKRAKRLAEREARIAAGEEVPDDGGALDGEEGFLSDEDDSDKEDGDGGDGDGDGGDGGGGGGAEDPYKLYDVHPDLRVLLNSAVSLMQSRNSAVVLAVASLFYYCAPRAEAQQVGKSLTRLVSHRREIAVVVLTNMRYMAMQRPEMFEPHLAEFFITLADEPLTRLKKLEIITLIASEGNIHTVLEQLRSYVTFEDPAFVREAIRAIGKCAARVPAVIENCIQGLMTLLGARSTEVVAESVIAIVKLLQMETGADKREIVIDLVRLLDTIEAPLARAAIVWVIGEYHELIPQYAPDVLRKLAKTFRDEHAAVRLQTLTFAAKLTITNAEQSMALCKYILLLAKFDRDHDIRDRGRLMRVVLFNTKQTAPTLQAHARRLFMTSKPPPEMHIDIERVEYTFGSLSLMVHHAAPEYVPLPAWSDNPPVVERNVAAQIQRHTQFSVTSMGSDNVHGANGAYNGSPSSGGGFTSAMGGGGGGGGDGGFYDDGGDDAGFYDDGDGGFYSDEPDYDDGGDADADFYGAGGDDGDDDEIFDWDGDGGDEDDGAAAGKPDKAAAAPAEEDDDDDIFDWDDEGGDEDASQDGGDEEPVAAAAADAAPTEAAVEVTGTDAAGAVADAEVAEVTAAAAELAVSEGVDADADSVVADATDAAVESAEAAVEAVEPDQNDGEEATAEDVAAAEALVPDDDAAPAAASVVTGEEDEDDSETED